MASLPREIKQAIKVAVVWILILFFVLNPAGSSFATSVNSQEFFTYHLRDMLMGFSEEKVTDTQGYYLSTGTYETAKEGDLFGTGKGKNLIVVQLESVQNMLIGAEYEGQEITPHLNQLIREQGSFYFDNYYQQLGSGNTSDAEFATNNSLMGSIESFTYQLYEENYFKGLPWIMKEDGYQTAVMHGYKKEFWNRVNMYPVQGFDTFVNSDILVSDNIEGIGGGNIVGISDRAFYAQAVEKMLEMQEGVNPFYSFLITLSSHNPFHLPDHLKGIELKASDENTLFGNYINSVHFADQCLEEFLAELKDNGLYENSVIAFYGDHFGLSKSDTDLSKRVTEFLGFDYDYDIMLNVPLIIHIPEVKERKTISISGGQMDFLPTIAYVMGVEELNTLYLGQNLFTAESGFVASQTHFMKGSYIKDDMVFEISRDGVFENSRAYHRITREAQDITGCMADYKRAKQTVELSAFYLKNDVIRRAMVDGKTMEEIIADLSTPEKKPSRLKLVQVAEKGSSNGNMDLASFVKWMKENKDERVLVAMEDIQAGLKRLEEEYGGKTGRTGVIKYIDSEMNLQFNEIKNRIIPVISVMEEHTRLEYLGYSDIVLMPEPGQYTMKQMADFITLNKPYAIAIPASEAAGQFRYLLRGDTFIYTYDVEGLGQKAFASALGVDGLIQGL